MTPKKIIEKRIVTEFLKIWKPRNNKEYIIDEDHLKSRKDNENPDAYILNLYDHNDRIPVEITHAADTQAIEIRDRTWEKMIANLRQILKDHDPGINISINSDTVIKKNLVKSDLKKFSNDLNSLLNKDFNQGELEHMGYKVITQIHHSKGNGSTFALSSSEAHKKANTDYNLSYFEIIEQALQRKMRDSQKLSSEAKKTILLIDTNYSVRDEIDNIPINENEIDDYCSFVSKYLNVYKEIYIIERGYSNKLIPLRNLAEEIFNYVT